MLTDEEGKQFQIDRANFVAKSALSRSQMWKGRTVAVSADVEMGGMRKVSARTGTT